MRKKLLHNLGLKLASLMLAFVLWFLVVQIEDPKDSVSFSNIPVKLINTELLEQEGKVYEVLENTDEVRVTIEAPRSILAQISKSDIVAEADVSKLTDINTIAISYYIENLSVDSIEGSHEVVRLNVEEKSSKWLRLYGNTMGDVAEGYMISSVSLDQTNIEITGPESAVSRVEYAAVDIGVTGATTNLSANVDIQLFDAGGNIIEQDNIKKNVNTAHITVEVLATKEVPVVIEYMGVPEEGYMATGEVESSVSWVLVAGKTTALENVTAITIPKERMNITGASGDMIDIINIKEYLPDNIKLADKNFDGKITATVFIEPVVEKELEIPVENIAIMNVPDGLEAEVLLGEDVTSYHLEVSGLAEVINPITQQTVTGYVDVAAYMDEMEMETLEEGVYEMPVSFNLSEEAAIRTSVVSRIRFTMPEAE